jgi:DNA (cytosine-5)-methyltransferase 1
MPGWTSTSRQLQYASVCSGVEAPSVAWGPLGWQPKWFSEIDVFARAVLAHQFPQVPNLGDMRAVDGAAWRGKLDLLVGGTPCVAFSFAGPRRSLADPRGNLTMTFADLCDAAEPPFVVWENVPGALSLPDNAFGHFIAALCGWHEPLSPPDERRWPNEGLAAGPRRTVAWRVVDARHFGLPQSRSRLFVVGVDRSTGVDPGQVLLDAGTLHGAPEEGALDPPPAAPAAAGGAGAEGGARVYAWQARVARNGRGNLSSLLPCLTAQAGRTGKGDAAPLLLLMPQRALRRLTPEEAEAAQGLPRGWTDVPFEDGAAPDGLRWKAIGNSIAVPCLRWLGERLRERIRF